MEWRVIEVPAFQAFALADTRMRIYVEPWFAECLLAIPELLEQPTQQAFDSVAVAWLEENQADIAAQIAADHDMALLGWAHIDGSPWGAPYGATAVWMVADTLARKGGSHEW